MYWVGVFIMFIMSIIALIIKAYKDKYLSVTSTVIIMVIAPFTSWAGILVSVLLCIFYTIVIIAYEGTNIMLWKSKNYKE